MEEGRYIQQTLLNGLQGRGSHVSPAHVFEVLDWRLVGEVPDGATHSVWQILDHMIYWQEFCLALLRNETPESPSHASDTWTTNVSPTNEDEWNDAVQTFLDGLRTAEQMTDDELGQTVAGRRERSRSEVLGMLIGHNSYHLGQVVLVRQMLGTRPPPSGGDTW